MKEDIKLIRTRHIPNERMELKKDRILYVDEEIVITQWDVINPRNDISWGMSVYYLKNGYKISKMYDKEDNFVQWYCDIIQTHINGNEYEFEDLLLDVVIKPDNSYVVMDADEFAQAIEENMITKETACVALRSFNELVRAISEGKFGELTEKLDSYL